MNRRAPHVDWDSNPKTWQPFKALNSSLQPGCQGQDIESVFSLLLLDLLSPFSFSCLCPCVWWGLSVQTDLGGIHVDWEQSVNRRTKLPALLELQVVGTHGEERVFQCTLQGATSSLTYGNDEYKHTYTHKELKHFPHSHWSALQTNTGIIFILMARRGTSVLNCWFDVVCVSRLK